MEIAATERSICATSGSSIISGTGAHRPTAIDRSARLELGKMVSKASEGICRSGNAVKNKSSSQWISRSEFEIVARAQRIVYLGRACRSPEVDWRLALITSP